MELTGSNKMFHGASNVSGIIPSSMADLSSYSRFVQRLRRRYAQELHLLPEGAPVLATMRTCFETLRQTQSCSNALRMLRQLVMERLVVLDCEQHADLSVITRAVTPRSPNPTRRQLWHTHHPQGRACGAVGHRHG